MNFANAREVIVLSKTDKSSWLAEYAENRA